MIETIKTVHTSQGQRYEVPLYYADPKTIKPDTQNIADGYQSFSGELPPNVKEDVLFVVNTNNQSFRQALLKQVIIHRRRQIAKKHRVQKLRNK